MSEMHSATGHADTDAASRYLQQLCKHWSHKGAAEFDETHGVVTFEAGNRIEMNAVQGRLDVVASVAAGGDLERWKQVIEQHLERFAFREDFALVWAA